MNDKKGIFLAFYDNIEQTCITFKLLEPLDTLAKRAARSAASCINLCNPFFSFFLSERGAVSIGPFGPFGLKRLKPKLRTFGCTYILYTLKKIFQCPF